MISKWICGTGNDIKKSGFIWNSIGGIINAGQSAFLLFFVSRKLGLTAAGIVTIGYAIANLIQTIGRYGIRNYQVTDVKENFCFSDYYYCRVITVIVTSAAAVIYLVYCLRFGEYSVGKTIIIAEIIALKMIEAFEGVYIGRYQQKGRLDIGAKIYTLHMIISTALICIMLQMNCSLYVSLMAGIFSSIIIDYYFIRKTVSIVDGEIDKFNKTKVLKLLKIGIPLCTGLTLYMYVGNAPKYLIDVYMSEESQAIFGYVMMPMFVITLLNNFILQPIIKELGEIWNNRDLLKFRQKIIMQYVTIFILAIIVLALGILVGLPLLSILYAVDLTNFKMEFSVLMLGAAFYTLSYYLTVILTTIRKQNMIVFGYLSAVIIYILVGHYLIIKYEMLGAALLYLETNIIISIIFTILVIIGIRKNAID